MKFLQVILSLSLLLILVPSLVVESSSSLNDISVNNITSGTFLYSNDPSPYWLSPSGNIAFGFYQLPWSPDQYTVGIWFVKSSNKTLVWTANREDLIIPVNKPSAIRFTKEGKLILRILLECKEIPLLPNAPELVSYAELHDNGNFVLYGSDSQIVWESFNYPTDTLLGGQKIKAGYDLISNSGEYKLSLNKINGTVMILDAFDLFVADVSSWLWGTPKTLPESLNLDTTGMLYLANSNGAVRKIIYKDETMNNVKGDYIYRATLDSRGYFILFKERIDGNQESSSDLVLLWASYQLWSMKDVIGGSTIPIVLVGVLLAAIVMLVRAQPDHNLKEEETTKIIEQKKKEPRKTNKEGYEKLDTSDLEFGRT